MKKDKIYDGGSEYSEVVENLSGIYNQTKVSVPSNQVFISFEANSKFDNKNKDFMAYIIEKGNICWWFYCQKGMIKQF